MVDRIQEGLPRERLPDDEQPGDRHDHREHRQGEHRRPNRAVDLRGRDRLGLERDRLVRDHRLDHLPEGGDGGRAALQPGCDPEVLDRARVPAQEGGRELHLGRVEPFVDDDGPWTDADADHAQLDPGAELAAPERGDALLEAQLTALEAREVVLAQDPGVQHAPDAQVLVVRQHRVDENLVGARGLGHAPVEDLRARERVPDRAAAREGDAEPIEVVRRMHVGGEDRQPVDPAGLRDLRQAKDVAPRQRRLGPEIGVDEDVLLLRLGDES